jgi:hypothetical protein
LRLADFGLAWAIFRSWHPGSQFFVRHLPDAAEKSSQPQPGNGNHSRRGRFHIIPEDFVDFNDYSDESHCA